MRNLNLGRFGLWDNIRFYDCIVGIHFGNSYTGAYYMMMGSHEKYGIVHDSPRPAVIDKTEHIIKTCFSIEDGKVIFSESGKYSRFLKTPDELLWGVKYPDDEEEITCRELVQEYITAVIENIEANNPEIFGKRILYVIGCPPDDDWLMYDRDVKYARILREKNGRSIAVVNEAEGAVQMLVKGMWVLPSRNEGILVLDLKSDKSSWTFVHAKNGYEAAYGSVGFGVEHMDISLVEYILNKNGRALCEVKDMSKVKEQSRRIREEIFMNSGKASKESRIICELKDGSVVEEFVNYRMIERAAETKRVSYNSIDGKESGTWKELCSSFMRKACNEVREKYPDVSVLSVMITGGAAKIPFVYDIFEETLSGEFYIIADPAPWETLSKGMAYAGLLGLRC